MPPSSGWARSTSGQHHSSPWRSSERLEQNGEPTAIGCTAEQSSCSKPGRVSSLVRAPPPIVAAASSTVTSTPRAASAAAQARPLGPEPTTIASLTRSRRRRGGPVTSTGNSHDSSSQGPRATMSATFDPALLEQACRGVVDPVALALDVRGLGLERHDPQLAGLERAALLHSVEQLLVVEVAVAEVPAVDDPRDQLALAHVVGLDVVDRRTRQEPVERAAVRVHGAEGEPLVEQVARRVSRP